MSDSRSMTWRPAMNKLAAVLAGFAVASCTATEPPCLYPQYEQLAVAVSAFQRTAPARRANKASILLQAARSAVDRYDQDRAMYRLMPSAYDPPKAAEAERQMQVVWRYIRRAA